VKAKKEGVNMWCKHCHIETFNDECELCGAKTEEDIPLEIYWCDNCKAPVIKLANEHEKNICPLCGNKTKYLSTDLRVVYPEERLLIECLLGEPLKYADCSVWACDSTYFFNGKKKKISSLTFANADVKLLISEIEKYSQLNNYTSFDKYAQSFVNINKDRLNYLKKEAFEFVRETASNFTTQTTIVSFSGGKDSTVTADLVVRALGNPCIVHVFGNTTLEFPMTIAYVDRFRQNHPKTIFKIAKNKEQEFYKVCDDIGPPARMMRWCCSMFKTGPITRVLNNMYRDKKILTFYGIRKCESVSRSKYNRFENTSESVKIQKQAVASPIFFWRDIDIWLYLIGEKVDFNDAYRLGYDRVGCWCCPNNSERAQFLSKVYMPEEYKKWRDFLIEFAKSIGKPDPEVYVDTGKWKARQGGNGVAASEDVKIKYTNCTAEEHAKIYNLNKPIDESFYSLFTPFGKVSKELGRKLIGEIIVLDVKNNVPIISLQPFQQVGYDYSIKIKTMNVANHDDLQRMISYQIRKYNACRKCLKCESICDHGAIHIVGDTYRIDETKCKRCKKCINPKYLDSGCLMNKYLATRSK
jgi:phosphoadenosine phosphosulfate reductase